MDLEIQDSEAEVRAGFVEKVFNPARLAALRRLGLLDTPAEEGFDRLGRLAQKFLAAPVALVTLVDDERQFFKSCLGLPEPWASWRSTPLSHSFCKHVVNTDVPLMVTDARTNPLFRENLGVRDLDIIAYLGVPLRIQDQVLGSFCVIDSKPRDWTSEQAEILGTLAECVMTEIALRGEIEMRTEALDQLGRANATLRSFNYSLGHDLGSAIRKTLGFASLLREECEEPLKPECRKHLSAVVGGAARAAEMLSALQRLTEADRQNLEITEIDLSAMAESIVKDLRAAEPQHRVSVRIGSGLRIRADAGLLRLALENLLRNAWKFSSRSPDPQIEFGVTKTSEAEQTFFVRDNGIGFSMEEASLLFTPFSRLSSARTYSGTGIGLQTVYRIVERHRGKIWALAEPGQGATFYFTVKGETA